MKKEEPVWIFKAEASEMLGFKPRTLRKYVKAGRLNIAYSDVNRRNLLYNKVDIQKEITAHSNLIKKS